MTSEKLTTEIRQAQIAQAALDTVARHGMKGLSVARVAHQIGLVPSAIYRHYKGKDQILDAVLHLIQERLLSNVDTICDMTSDPLERLSQLVQRHVLLIRENEAIPQVIFSEELYSKDKKTKNKIYKVIKNYLNKVADIIREGQASSNIRTDSDPETLSVMFLGLIQPAAILWHVSEGKFDVTKHLEKSWQIFKHAIAVE